MLSIRLSRVGRKKAPTYRIVLMPKQHDPWGRVIEILGHYNPRKHPKELVLNSERIQYWISKGAEATDTMWNLLLEQGVVIGEKRKTVQISKKRQKKITDRKTEAEEASKKAAAKAQEKAEAAKEVEAAKEAAATQASVANQETSESSQETTVNETPAT